MNLRDLHSPQPLQDTDFAAIRARVRSRIRERRAVPLLLRLAFAMLLVVAFVTPVQHRAPKVPAGIEKPLVVAVARTTVTAPVPVERRPLPAAGFPARARRPLRLHSVQAPLAAAAQETAPDEAAAPQETARVERPRVARETAPAVARIELQTADPEIRIIWIVHKESS
jgi:hypothetical protein